MSEWNDKIKNATYYVMTTSCDVTMTSSPILMIKNADVSTFLIPVNNVNIFFSEGDSRT
jgi:hypothetical protein